MSTAATATPPFEVAAIYTFKGDKIARVDFAQMSVRRLAKEQPASFAFSKDSHGQGRLVESQVSRRAQAVGGDPDAVAGPEAGRLGLRARHPARSPSCCEMPVIRVLEVATFYTMFQLQPVGKVALVQVCGTTPCMLRGALDLRSVLKAKIGAGPRVSADGLFTWEEVECLGACCNAPMAPINDYYYEDLTPESLAQILDDFAAGKSPKPGSL